MPTGRGESIRLITYNIQYGLGRDGRFNLDRIVNIIREADIIALQEVEAGWNRSGNIHQAEEIARQMPNHWYIWGPTVDILKKGRNERRGVDRSRRQFGNMLLSRYPILSSRNFLYPKLGALTHHSFQRGALETTIDTPLGLVRVYSTHLCHLSAIQRRTQIDMLLAIHRNAPLEGPVLSGVPDSDTTWGGEYQLPIVPLSAILLGDFNLRPSSPEYETIVGPNFGPYGRVTLINGFADAWELVRGGTTSHSALASDQGATFYSDFDNKIGERVDYCFVSSTWMRFVRAAEVLSNAEGSDHQPLKVTFASD
jgi:endonuclease/exonuclease/phosphatase family metal-dependent hydrolase